MSHNSISDAFESVDVTPSAAFRQQLRGEFLAALEQQEASDEIVADNTVTVIEVAPSPAAAPESRSRCRCLDLPSSPR